MAVLDKGRTTDGNRAIFIVTTTNVNAMITLIQDSITLSIICFALPSVQVISRYISRVKSLVHSSDTSKIYISLLCLPVLVKSSSVVFNKNVFPKLMSKK